MNAMKILALAVGVAFLGRDPSASGQQEVTNRYESTLSFKTCLFEADIKTGLAPVKSRAPGLSMNSLPAKPLEFSGHRQSNHRPVGV
jgi:hypothetical protein